MRTPEFWNPGGGGALQASLLAPLAWGYDVAGQISRSFVASRRVGVPVICVGNLVAGGAGKTPLALDIGARLAGRGIAVHFLTRGHGGSESGPLRVDGDRHDVSQVGDEALLLAPLGADLVGPRPARRCHGGD